MTKFIIRFFLLLSLTTVHADKLPPLEHRGEISDTWVGYAEGNGHYFRCTLNEDGTGLFTLKGIGFQPHLYRIKSWGLEGYSVNFELEPVNAGSPALWLKGSTAGDWLKLAVGEKESTWKTQGRLDREEAFREIYETAKAAMHEVMMVDGNTAFALKLHQELRSTEGNLFYSPYSLSTALGMTYAGARNTTAKQMKEVLGLPGDRSSLPALFGGLQHGLNSLQKEGDVSLSLANGLWAEKNYTILPEYTDLVQQSFKAKLSAADFVGKPEQERQGINSWVETKTNGKIKDLIPSGLITPLTRLVLVNAIYFKADWAQSFNPSRTREMPFHVSSEQTVKAKMMFQSGSFGLAQDADTQVLELPYKGNRLSMLVLLPKDKNGLRRLEESLTPKKLSTLVSSLKETEVDVTVPSFKLETHYKLVPTLERMGITDAFNGDADFSGMDGTRNLVISNVLHKAFVEVDEKGTEAAAATAVIIVERGLSAPNPVFTADHPFLFLIRDTTTESILFMGRISDPTRS